MDTDMNISSIEPIGSTRCKNSGQKMVDGKFFCLLMAFEQLVKIYVLVKPERKKPYSMDKGKSFL